jgi:DNA modification methylase
LRGLPDASVDVVCTDPMFGTSSRASHLTCYRSGSEPLDGSARAYWAYHEQYYLECLRVLRPGGKLAWATGTKHHIGPDGSLSPRTDWYGGFLFWTLHIYYTTGRRLDSYGHTWIVQDAHQRGVRFPAAHSCIIVGTRRGYRRCHPCSKSLEEMLFMVRWLSEPNDIVLDPFGGIGTTALACQRLGRRWILAEREPYYCRVARFALERDRKNHVV